MKKTTICLFLLSGTLLTQSCSTAPAPVTPAPVTPAPVTPASVTPASVTPAPAAANHTVPKIINLQHAMPGPINVDNEQAMNALSNDPMLSSNPMITNNNSGQLSGSAEANLINADGASFQDIDQQVTNDISSSNSSISSGNAGISDASKISNELGAKDIENLSVPNQN